MLLKWTWAFKPSFITLTLMLFAHGMATAAILEPSLETAVPFFKAPESPFPSGQARKSNLIETQQGSYTDFHYKALWGQKRIDVNNDQIVREIDVAFLARARKKTPLHLMPELNSSSLLILQAGQTLEIESLRGIWARVKATPLHKGYVLLTELENAENDLGVWLTMADTSLRQTADRKSLTVVKLPPLTRLKMVQIQGEFAYVTTATKAGYVALNEVVGRSDFAQWAWHGLEKKWKAVLYRNGSSLVLAGNQQVPLKNFSAFRGAKNRALIAGDHPNVNRGARVELIEPTAVKWTQSLMKDHGLVWWKTDLLAKDSEATSISTADLMKKNLKGISFDPKTKKGLASAGGVFRTVDGKTWTKISFFGQDNWPVSLHPSGVWFVGPYRSTDEGVSFKPSIKWSELVETLQYKVISQNKAFNHFRVLDIENISRNEVALKIDTGLNILKIKSHVHGTYWTLLK